MHTYSQTTGVWSHTGRHFKGYSGHGAGLNNPAHEAVHSEGPIPKGRWHIGPVRDGGHLGPVVMDLTPVGHDAHGRSLFRIHGDNSLGNHSASDGCIILDRKSRELIAGSGDKDLVVVQ